MGLPPYLSSIERRNGVLRIEIRERRSDGSTVVVGLLACDLSGPDGGALSELLSLALKQGHIVRAQPAANTGSR